MTPQQLVGLGVRLFAVWLVITNLSYFTEVLRSTFAAGSAAFSFAVVGAYLVVGVYLVSAVCLWFFPMEVANALIPRTKFENRMSLNTYELARVGSSLVGLLLLTETLPALVWFIFRSFMFPEAGSTFSSLAPEAKLDVAVVVFKLVFAVFVIVKSGAFAAFVVPEVEQSGGVPAAVEI
jgi:hypothetical protein